MRVCMLAYTLYEFDNRVMRYAEALVQRGDHVDVLVVGRKGQQRREVIRGVNVHRLQRRTPNETGPFSYLLKVFGFLLNSALVLTLMHFRRPFQVIHVHSVPDFEVFATLIPKLLGAKCILDIHDIVPEFYRDKFGVGERSLIYRSLLLVERLSTRFSNHVIAANDIWGERLTGRSVPAEKCSVYLNYPDRALFARKEGVSKVPGFLMLYPGTLSVHQGLDIALRAMPAILKEVPEARIEIYGHGSEYKSLVALRSELGLEDSVHFYGVLPIEEIARVMESAHLGIVPKRADLFGNEAFSTKILEFMALGVPVLAANTAIDTFYFDDSQICFFESGDEADFARRVIELAQNPAEQARLSKNGEAKAAEFSWENHKQRYYDLVDSLVRGDA